MNDNAPLLRVAEYPLHDPALEVLRVMKEKRISVRLKVPKSATPKAKANNVEFEVFQVPAHVENPAEVVAKVVKETVQYFNAKRKIQVVAKGNKVVLVSAESKKKGKGSEGEDTEEAGQ